LVSTDTVLDVATVSCGECSHVLDEPPGADPAVRTPCPRCGGLTRNFDQAVGGTVTPHSTLAAKARPATGGKPYAEIRTGADVHRASGTWSRLHRVIDRRHDHYLERIIAEDGSVVRDVDERLTDHRGHGADKSSPKTHP
jgi:hypothetical protein